MAKEAIAKSFFRKYGAVIFFPTFTFTTILADLNHTWTWKREQNLLLQKERNLTSQILKD